MSQTGSYQLSHDEQQHAKACLLDAARLQRLQQVREQARQIAKSRSHAYQRLCVQSAESLQQQLCQLLIEQRNRELNALKAEYEQALAGMAAAQKQAAATEQQLVIERQQQQQLFLRRQQQALQRFAAALSKVHSARRAELQAVLERVQRRQQIMQQEKAAAHAFGKQARQQAAQEARQRSDLHLLEEQRRRQNQFSRIDFRYSRLHELGVPQLVVNNKELPLTADDDAATQAEELTARAHAEQVARQQRRQEDAKRAAERGARAHMLLQAEQSRQRMEQALQEMESNEVQQRKQDIAAGRLNAAPLLRKWRQQKRQAQARRAFEHDFLHSPAKAVQAGLSSFVIKEPAEQQQSEDGTATLSEAAAAERALQLVAELQRLRRVEKEEEAQQRQQNQQQARSNMQAAARGTSSSSLLSDIEVAVDDLMTHIPEPSSVMLLDSAAGPLMHMPAPSEPPEQVSPATGTPSQHDEDQQQEQVQLHVPDTERTPMLPADDSHLKWQAAVATGTPGAASAASASLDSLEEIIRAADEVLQQLPAEMQAAAAARASAAASPAAPSANQLAAPASWQAEEPEDVGAAAAIALPAARSSTLIEEPLESLAGGSEASVADAAAVLQELRLLQEELGVQVFGSSVASSDLEELAAFDAEVERVLQQDLALTQQSLHQAAAALPASTAAAKPSLAAPLRQPVQPATSLNQPAGPAAPGAAAAAAVADAQQLATTHQAGAELEELIDKILAPQYPANILGEQHGPLPSADSPRMPPGRSALRAAAPTAAAGSRGPQSSQLAKLLKAVQHDLKALDLTELLGEGRSATSSSIGSLPSPFLQGPAEGQDAQQPFADLPDLAGWLASSSDSSAAGWADLAVPLPQQQQQLPAQGRSSPPTTTANMPGMQGLQQQQQQQQPSGNLQSGRPSSPASEPWGPLAAAATMTAQRTSVMVNSAAGAATTSSVVSLPSTLGLQGQYQQQAGPVVPPAVAVAPNSDSADVGHGAAAAPAAPAAEVSSSRLLQQLLSHMGDSSDMGDSPTTSAAAALFGSSSTNSSISSILDDELDQLLQRALADATTAVSSGTAAPAAFLDDVSSPAAPPAASAAHSGGPYGHSVTASSSTSTLQLAGSAPAAAAADAALLSDQALEALLLASTTGMVVAQAGASRSAAASTTATSIPSTVWKMLPASAQDVGEATPGLQQLQDTAAAAAAASSVAEVVSETARRTDSFISMPNDIEQQLTLAAEQSLRAAAGTDDTFSRGSAASTSLPETITRATQQQQQPPATAAMAAAPGSRRASWHIARLHTTPAGTAAAASDGTVDGSSSSSPSIPSTVAGKMRQTAGSSGSGTGSSSRSSAGKPGLIPATGSALDAGGPAGWQAPPLPLPGQPLLGEVVGEGPAVLSVLAPIAEEATASDTLGSVTSSQVLLSQVQGGSPSSAPSTQQQLPGQWQAQQAARGSSSTTSISRQGLGSGHGMLPRPGGTPSAADSGDSFSDVVSDLLGHIDDTFAALSGATAGISSHGPHTSQLGTVNQSAGRAAPQGRQSLQGAGRQLQVHTEAARPERVADASMQPSTIGLPGTAVVKQRQQQQPPQLPSVVSKSTSPDRDSSSSGDGTTISSGSSFTFTRSMEQLLHQVRLGGRASAGSTERVGADTAEQQQRFAGAASSSSSWGGAGAGTSWHAGLESLRSSADTDVLLASLAAGSFGLAGSFSVAESSLLSAGGSQAAPATSAAQAGSSSVQQDSQPGHQLHVQQPAPLVHPEFGAESSVCAADLLAGQLLSPDDSVGSLSMMSSGSSSRHDAAADSGCTSYRPFSRETRSAAEEGTVVVAAGSAAAGSGSLQHVNRHHIQQPLAPAGTLSALLAEIMAEDSEE